MEKEKFKVTMTLEEDEMIVLRGGEGTGTGTGTVKCPVEQCASCGTCDAISTRGWNGARILTGSASPT